MKAPREYSDRPVSPLEERDRMPDRAALVTGASRGIGLALADALGDEGYALTISARKPDTLEQTAAGLRSRGTSSQAFAANMADEQAIQRGRPDAPRAVRPPRRARQQRRRRRRGAAGEQQTKFVDLQLGVNLRAIVLLYRECQEMLVAAGAEHRNAVVVNLASIAGKSPSPWLSVYSATKAAVLAYTQAMNKELERGRDQVDGVRPGFVDTDMTDFVKGSVSPEEMMRADRHRRSAAIPVAGVGSCVVPEIMFGRPERDGLARRHPLHGRALHAHARRAGRDRCGPGCAADG